MPKTVLFLCSGNYYRSRFAEILFNALADKSRLNWRAVSRALGETTGTWKTGPISPYAVEGLESRGIRHDEEHREPELCARVDFESADLVIALKESEHRPMIEKRFADCLHRVEFWHVHDVDHATPEEALPELEQLVRSLVDRLSSPRG